MLHISNLLIFVLKNYPFWGHKHISRFCVNVDVISKYQNNRKFNSFDHCKKFYRWLIKFIMLRVKIGLNFILKFCPFRQCESPSSLHWTYKEGLVCPFSKKYIANSTPIAQNIRQKLRNFWVSSTHILPIHCYFQNFSQYSVA